MRAQSFHRPLNTWPLTLHEGVCGLERGWGDGRGLHGRGFAVGDHAIWETCSLMLLQVSNIRR
jgi:hypothetical protein